MSFREAPDYEDPVDVTSTDPVSGAGDNAYVVTVEVTSGAGSQGAGGGADVYDQRDGRAGTA